MTVKKHKYFPIQQFLVYFPYWVPFFLFFSVPFHPVFTQSLWFLYNIVRKKPHFVSVSWDTCWDVAIYRETWIDICLTPFLSKNIDVLLWGTALKAMFCQGCSTTNSNNRPQNVTEKYYEAVKATQTTAWASESLEDQVQLSSLLSHFVWLIGPTHYMSLIHT